ncbi:MAG: chemotaxis protein CheB [Myxococcaceae bacterium]|nr:chemotaxis protein CheB [Myxococcaceae bacterium]
MKTKREMADLGLVCIGGSQGGFEALEKLLPQLPADYPCAVVVLLHQYRHGAGNLPELLSTRTAMPVKAVHDRDPVIPGHLFVAPANYHLLLERHHAFALNTDAPVQYARPSIDVLFESAAHVYGPRTTGVLLSGASIDGASGLKQIKAVGGLVACQHPDTASGKVMPQAGIDTTTVDKVGSPQELGQWLKQLHP